MKYTTFNENLLEDVFNEKAKFDIKPIEGIMPVFEDVEEFDLYRNLLTKKQFEEEATRRFDDYYFENKSKNFNPNLILKIKRELKQELEPEIQNNQIRMLEVSVNNDDQPVDYFYVITSLSPDLLANGFSPVIHAFVTNFEAAKQIANEISKYGYGLINLHVSYANGKGAFLKSKDLCIYDNEGKVIRHSKQYYIEHPEEKPKESGE